MRDIKFRAWDKDKKTMITDKQDFIPLIVTNAGVFRLSPTHDDNLYSLVEPERFELMQYTGLKDRNGVDIYEGDIVLLPERVSRGDGGYDDEIVSVIFDLAEFKAINNDGDWSLNDVWAGFDCEVIGNIHENPELMEQNP